MEVVEFGKYIKSLRKKKDLTLIELSQISGVSHPYLSQIENGKTKTVASPDILRKVAGPLGIEYKELMIQAGYLESFVNELKKDDDGEIKWIDQLSKTLSYMGDNELIEALNLQRKLDGFLLEGAKEKLSIENFFKITQDVKIYYRDIELTAEDRQRILDMLKLMFPDRQ